MAPMERARRELQNDPLYCVEIRFLYRVMDRFVDRFPKILFKSLAMSSKAADLVIGEQ